MLCSQKIRAPSPQKPGNPACAQCIKKGVAPHMASLGLVTGLPVPGKYSKNIPYPGKPSVFQKDDKTADNQKVEPL